MDDLIRYRAFVEAINRKSITAAAEAMGYTQPGISRMLRSLEEEWGIKLLERGKKGVVATDAARRIYPHCVSVLKTQKSLEQTLQQIKCTVVSTIRIGGYFSVLMSWIPDLLDLLHRTYPGLEFQIFEGNAEEQIQMMRDNLIDVAFLSSSAPKNYKFIPLYRDPIVAIMPSGHPLTALSKIKTADLTHYPFLIKPEHAYGALKEMLADHPNMVDSGFSVKTDNALLGLVKKGMGIGVVGEMVAKAGTQVEYRHFDPPYYRTIGLAIPAWKPLTPALQTFITETCRLYQSAEFESDNQFSNLNE